MWADFFVSAEGACRRGGLSMEMFSVAAAVSAMSAVPSVSVKHLETYNHIQQTINDK